MPSLFMRNEPPEVASVDGASISVLVDNVSDGLSTVPAGVTNEVDNLIEAGAKEFSGEGLCCACWGISLVVSGRIGHVTRTVLFDGGPAAYAIDHNAPRLGIDMGAIEAVVLSHGHIDHAGGLPAALRRIVAANGGRPVPVHVNPGMFVHRGDLLESGEVFPLEDIPNPETLAQAGGRVQNAVEERVLLDHMFYLSGEIPRVTSYEKGLPGQVNWNEAEARWEPDPWVMDERFLALKVKDKGVLIFTACSHAGIVNILRNARDIFAPAPLYGIVGGFHLAGRAFEKILPDTIRDLKEFNLQVIVPGHCTGWRAVHALLDAFGESVVVPSAVGRRHLF
ncbi:MAG TPA: MBL fold metallo-hydrolase [Alphaproteobacteria bacterium]|nr:MBL fold metallo-hydrolase [Alphaproteobacteria bacterium]